MTKQAALLRRYSQTMNMAQAVAAAVISKLAPISAKRQKLAATTHALAIAARNLRSAVLSMKELPSA